MPHFGDALCSTRGCGGQYRIVSRTNWVNFQHSAPLIGGGFCPACRKAHGQRQLAERREREAAFNARRAHEAHRDTLVEAMIARLRLSQHDVDEICEFVLRKRDRARDEEYDRETGGGQ
jgi:hypothetical protein